MPTVTFDSKSLIINGKREFILSGAFHYFRLPHPDLWEKRLRLMKAAGLNAVDVYIPWNYHNPSRGEYIFTNERNLEKLFALCEKLELYVIARAGPYACAELYGGGFPAWLLQEECLLRCSRQGEFHYDPNYVEKVMEWYNVILPRLVRCRSLILFQIENEYQFLPFVRPPLLYIVNSLRKINPDLLMQLLNSGKLKKTLIDLSRLMPTKGPRSHNPYMKELYEKAKSFLDVPIFHNDVASFGERQLDVEIAAIDDYAISSFLNPWKNEDAFYSIDVMEEGCHKTGKHQPLFIAEFQGGWFDTWQGIGYPTIRKKLGVRQLDIALKSALAQGASLINIYMFCGGTTWGYLSSPDVYSSYDFAAPLSETGLPTERFYAVQKIASFIRKHEQALLTAKWEGKSDLQKKGIFYRQRTAGKTSFHFIRNMGNRRQERNGINIPPKAMGIVVKENGKQVDALQPIETRLLPRSSAPTSSLPTLNHWRASIFSTYLQPNYDDSHWQSFLTTTPVDFLRTGIFYGFMWGRACLSPTRKITIDARHLYTLYLNGKRFFSYDNFFNHLAVGDDCTKTVTLDTRPLSWKKQNLLTFLIASLGQNKGFEEDARNPRGLIRFLADGMPVKIRIKGGLFGEKEGLTPKKGCGVNPTKGTKIHLPHTVRQKEGVLLYSTTFLLPKVPFPIELLLQAVGFGNLYLNGYLIGRFWDRGPQRAFYLPEGILKEAENRLTFALWKREASAGLQAAKLRWANPS